MKVLSRFILLLSLLFIANTSSFADQMLTCSYLSPCPDGLVCMGNVGTGDGVCVLTGPQIVLCKIVEYFDKKLATIFAIFAVVMIGIAFFLGKISWGMILSVIMGIGIIKGATPIIKKVSGESEGYCSSAAIDYSAIIGTDCIADDKVIKNTSKIYNTKTDTNTTELCPTPLWCTRKTCTVGTGTHYIVQNGNHTREVLSAGDVYLPEDTKDLRTTKCTWADFQDSSKGCTTDALSCSEKTQSPNKDYFHCKNTCINTSFTKFYDANQYADCKEINVTA